MTRPNQRELFHFLKPRVIDAIKSEMNYAKAKNRKDKNFLSDVNSGDSEKIQCRSGIVISGVVTRDSAARFLNAEGK